MLVRALHWRPVVSWGPSPVPLTAQGGGAPRPLPPVLSWSLISLRRCKFESLNQTTPGWGLYPPLLSPTL